MQRQNESSSTIIFESQENKFTKPYQEQVEICSVQMTQKEMPNHTRTHTSDQSDSHSVDLSINKPKHKARQKQKKRQLAKKEQKEQSDDEQLEDHTHGQKNVLETKQIVTNLIKVKSLPRIKNRNKINIRQDIGQNQQINREQVQTNIKEYFINNEEENTKQEAWEGKQQNSQTTQNKQTKPTKTIQLQIQEPSFEKQPDHEFNQIKINIKTAKYEQHSNKQKLNHIFPCNAKRQLGHSDEENNTGQKQEEGQVQSHEDDEQCEQYDQVKYLHEIKAYNERKKLQNQKRIFRSPSVEIKFGQSQLQRFVRTPIRPGFQFESIITIDAGVFGMGNKYHLNQKYEPKILISAKKQIISLSSKFILSLNKDNHSRRHQGFMGIMESNFSGTAWTLNCPILSSKFSEGQFSSDLVPVLSASYSSSILGSKSTRDMNVFFVDPLLQKKQREAINLQYQLERKKIKNLVHLESSKPVFNKGKYQLDFKGIAKKPSNKNFILENKNNMNCLMFAKQSQNTYQMNIQFPLSLIQGFALCLTSLDSKLFVN